MRPNRIPMMKLQETCNFCDRYRVWTNGKLSKGEKRVLQKIFKENGINAKLYFSWVFYKKKVVKHEEDNFEYYSKFITE